MITAKVNTTVLNQRIAAWAQASGKTLPEAVKYQAGMLRQELWKGAPPKNLSKAKKKADGDVGKVFYPKPKQVFPKKKQGKGSTTWMFAGSKTLVGAIASDYRPNANVGELLKIRSESRGFKRGPAWQKIGKKPFTRTTRRGKRVQVNLPQGAAIINRVIVSRGALANLKKYIVDRFGRQKAAWAVDLQKLGLPAPPAWVARHTAELSAKRIGFTQANLNPERPTVTIVSRAKGVEHERSLANVRRAVKKRAAAIRADIKLYLRGIKKKAGFK